MLNCFKKFRFLMLVVMLPFLIAGCKAPWEPSSQEVIRNMANAMSTLSSLSISPANITATGKFVDPDDYSEVASGEEPQPTVEGTVTMKIEGQTETFYANTAPDYSYTTTATLKLEDGEYPFSFDSRAKGSIVYMNFLELPGLTDEYFDLSGLTGKWWEIPRSSAPSVYYPVPKVDEQAGDKNTEEEVDELTQEQIQDIEELIASTYVFSVTQDFGKEKCSNGKRAFHYAVKLDEAAAKELYLGYYEITEESFTSHELEDFENMIAAVSAMDIEVWIEKGDYFLCRMTLNGDYKNTENNQTYSVVADINMSAFNEKFEVARPTPAEPFTPENVLSALGINLNSLFKNMENTNTESLFNELDENLAPLKDEFKKLLELE